MKKSLLVFALTFFSISLFAQNQSLLYCGYNKYLDKLRAEGFDPDHDPSIQALETFTQNFDPAMASGSYQRGSTTIYVVPIVFHIIHKGGNENISNEQVYDAVRILNEDYNKQNSDTNLVVSTFSNNIANVGFEFRLAQKDALGNCTNGITRTFSSETDIGGYGAVDDVNRNLNNSTTNTNNIRFPRNMYLNVWVCNSLDGAAGYTNTPSGWTPSKYDGIWIQDSYVGSIGTSMPTTSRALTHEVGHWMNLRHTWGNTNNPGCTGQTGAPCNGDDNCTTDDNVTDTPNTIGWTTCNLTGKTCTSDPSPYDNVQNYMDYSYCSRMFTNGQKTRMVAAINSSTGQRNQLWTPSNLVATGVDLPAVLCQADFNASSLVICAGQSVDFSDWSYNGVTGWSWDFTGGTPSTSTMQNPTVTYTAPGTYAVSLTADDGSSSMTETRNAYITVLPSTGAYTPPLMEDFESTTAIPDNDWFVYNPDEGIAWDVTSTAAYSGTKSLKLNSSQIAAGDLDEFISTTYDLSGMSSVVVTFKYAFAQKNTSNDDILKVYVSNTCGETWTLRKQISSSALVTSSTQASAFTPTSETQWGESQITNITSSYLTSDFRIKFSFESGGGNNLYIDNINISTALGVEDYTYDFNLTAYPNPFDGNTTISFELDNEKQTEVCLYDVIGQKVMTLANGNMSYGKHTFEINGSELESGVYFVKLKAGNREMMKKIIVQH